MNKTGEIESAKDLASQLAGWDRRIFEIAAIQKDEQEPETLNLVCSFEPEPTCDTIGYFWIANLLTRMEFEDLVEAQWVDLSFKIGEQVFLPDGKSLRGLRDYKELWPNPDE